MANEPFTTQRMQAIAALTMAGFDLSDLSDDFLSNDSAMGFDLSFDIGEGRSLTLSWDEGLNQWQVCGRFKPETGTGPEAARIALQLSALLSADMRVTMAPDDAEAIEITAGYPTEGVDHEALAAVIIDVALWTHRIADAVVSGARAAGPSAERAEARPASPDLHHWTIRG